MTTDRVGKVLDKLELLLEGLGDKLSTAATLYAMDYMEAQEEGRHLDHGLDSKLKPIVAELLPLLRAGQAMRDIWIGSDSADYPQTSIERWDAALATLEGRE